MHFIFKDRVASVPRGTLHRLSKTPKRKIGELKKFSYFSLQITVRSKHDRAPTVFVFGTAVLNILQTRIKFHRNLAHFGSVIINFFGLHIENLTDRGDHSRCSAGSALFESFQFLDRNMPLFDLKPHIPGDLAKLAAPHSSIYLCSAASRYMTFEYPKSCAFSPDIRLAA